MSEREKHYQKANERQNRIESNTSIYRAYTK